MSNSLTLTDDLFDCTNMSMAVFLSVSGTEFDSSGGSRLQQAPVHEGLKVASFK